MRTMQPIIRWVFVVFAVLGILALAHPTASADIAVPGSTISDTFGTRGGTHMGTDEAAPEGAPIVTTSGGTVIEAGPAQGFGNWIRIQNDDGTISVVGHMWDDGVLVQAGQRVEPGQTIGLVGSAGDSTGPHAHIEKWVDGAKVDPGTVTDAPAPAPAPEPAPQPDPAVQVSAPAPVIVQDTSEWDKLAMCEASGNWGIDTGNGFQGGLQFLPSTWNEYGGGEFAPAANQASREEQIIVGSRVLEGQGPGAWPVCSQGLNLQPVDPTVAPAPVEPAPASQPEQAPAPIQADPIPLPGPAVEEPVIEAAAPVIESLPQEWQAPATEFMEQIPDFVPQPWIEQVLPQAPAYVAPTFEAPVAQAPAYQPEPAPMPVVAPVMPTPDQVIDQAATAAVQAGIPADLVNQGVAFANGLLGVR